MSQLNVNTIKNRTGTSGPVLTGLSTVSGSLVVSNDATVSGAATVSGNLSVTGNVSVGGTLTYEDITNVDSVGVVTARTGVRVTAGGLVVTAGVSTFFSDVTVRSSDPTLELTDTDGSTTSSLSANSGNIFYNTSSSNRDHIFRGSTTEVARITGDGFVGINSSSPAAILDVRGNSVVTGILTATTFKGDGSQLDGVGGDTDITSSLFT